MGKCDLLNKNLSGNDAQPKSLLRNGFYNIWSSSEGIYVAISWILHFKIRHRSLIVVVVMGLFLRNLSIVALEIWCLLIKVYVVSSEVCNVCQNGPKSII